MLIYVISYWILLSLKIINWFTKSGNICTSHQVYEKKVLESHQILHINSLYINSYGLDICDTNQASISSIEKFMLQIRLLKVVIDFVPRNKEKFR